MIDKFRPNTIQTYSGEGYFFEDPSPDAVRLDDIAHALSNMCRFAGHTKWFYSVAEHSVIVSRILEEQGWDKAIQRGGLLHDAHEAYIWDCPRPLKPLLGDGFKALADKADAVIAARFGLLPHLFHIPPVKLADDMALVAEANELMRYGVEVWSDKRYLTVPPLPFGVGPEGLLPGDAEEIFLDRAEELGLCGSSD